MHNELKPGRPRSLSEDQIAKLISTALHTKPKGKTQWSRRSRSFKLSTDPFFIEKVRDIVAPVSPSAGSRAGPVRG